MDKVALIGMRMLYILAESLWLRELYGEHCIALVISACHTATFSVASDQTDHFTARITINGGITQAMLNPRCGQQNSPW
jgi:hypothetical protein